MFDFLFDLTNDPVFCTLYISLILSLLFKITWVWAIEYKMSDTSSNLKESNKVFFHFSNKNIQDYQLNEVFEWLINITKRIECPDDNSEGHYSFSIKPTI